MLINDAPRPTWLIPRVLQAGGGARPVEQYGGLGVWNNSIPDSQSVDAWWAALEPLAVVLALAGYDTPEIAMGHFDEPNSYLRLLAWPGLVPNSTAHLVVAQGDWKAITGAELTVPKGGLGGRVVAALRVKARRWMEKPLGAASPYPAVALTGLGTAYVTDARTPAAEAADPFAAPADGWIVFTQPLAVPTTPAQTAVSARDARDKLAAALGAGGGAPIGLVRCLNPATWDSPLQPALGLDAFNALAQEIWTHLQTPGALEAMLKRALDDAGATAVGLLAAARSVDPRSLTKGGFFEAARAALAMRHSSLYPREVNGPALLAHFETTHWVVLLFALHELGLIRMLPFGITDPAILPAAVVTGDLPPVDLTGLYETAWGDLDTTSGRLANATLQLNQAGAWLDGWITDRQLFRHEFTAVLDKTTWQPSKGVRPPLLRFSGTFDGDPGSWIQIYDVAHPDEAVAFAITVGFGLGDADPADYTVVRQTHRARLRPSLLSQILPATVVAALEPDPDAEDPPPAWLTPRQSLETDLTPLHSSQQHGIEVALSTLFVDLRNSFFVDTGKSLDDTAADMLHALALNGVLDGAAVPDETTPVLERFRREARLQLVSQLISVGTTYWDFLDDRLVAEQLDSETLLALLDLEPGELGGHDPDAAEHRYDFTMSGPGIGGSGTPLDFHIEGGGYRVSCPIEHMPDCAPDPAVPHGWGHPEPYWGVMLEGGAGVAEGAGIAVNFYTRGDPNTLLTQGEWTRDDFAPSSIHIASVNAAASLHVGPGGGGAPPNPPGGKLPMDGTQYEVIVFISARGRAVSMPTDNTGWNVKVGLGVEASVSYTLGATLGLLIARGAATATLPVALSTFESTFGSNSELVLGDFAVGGWELTEGQRDLLARNVARYRPLLESPAATMHVEADASSTGPSGSNELLTWKRALAAYSWVRTVLTTGEQPALGTTSALAPATDHVILTGNGELLARTEGRFPDEFESDEWRRVKVKINDQVIVFL